MTAGSARSGPLRAVLAAIDGGARTMEELTRRTGAEPDVVRAALDHLVRSGHLSAEPLVGGCPAAGCAECPSGSGDRSVCGTQPGAADRPVLVVLSRRR